MIFVSNRGNNFTIPHDGNWVCSRITHTESNTTVVHAMQALDLIEYMLKLKSEHITSLNNIPLFSKLSHMERYQISIQVSVGNRV